MEGKALENEGGGGGGGGRLDIIKPSPPPYRSSGDFPNSTPPPYPKPPPPPFLNPLPPPKSPPSKTPSYILIHRTTSPNPTHFSLMASSYAQPSSFLFSGKLNLDFPKNNLVLPEEDDDVDEYFISSFPPPPPKIPPSTFLRRLHRTESILDQAKQNPRKGCFEIREEDGQVFVSLQDMKRPFSPVKDLLMKDVISDIVQKIK